MLRQLPAIPPHDRLLVGSSTFDDAGVFLLDADTALVQTVDFFTPVVDDPRTFGRIAVANALSDVYAMGGKPITALNLMCFPTSTLPLEVMVEILAGGQDKLAEAGVVLLGGHSVVDPEPKYGLAVTGLVHPQRIWTNAGAQVGDVLYLTKPLGIGVITTALKNGAGSEALARQATQVMEALNAIPAQLAQEFTVHACTDVTGFGLLGHLHELATASRVDVRVRADQVPVIPGTLELVEQGFVCGGSWANLRHLAPVLKAHNVPENILLILCDAITSGGLLLSVPQHEAHALEQRLIGNGIMASYVGDVIAAGTGQITVTV